MFPLAQVTCHAATPTGDQAGLYDYRCDESLSTDIFHTSDYVLLVAVHGRSYTVFSQQDVGDYDNSF